MTWFLLVVGAIVPVVFLFVDPAVFRSSRSLGVPVTAFLGQYRAFGYVATFLAAGLIVHATFSRRVRPFEAGMLYAASGVAFALGVVLIPVSLLGILFAGLGLLGLSPFFAAWAYLRRGTASHFAANGRLWSRAAALGICLFLLVPAAVQTATNLTVRWSVANIQTPGGRRALSALSLLCAPDELLSEYRESTDQDQKMRLALAYRHLTGEPIEMRLEALAD